MLSRIPSSQPSRVMPAVVATMDPLMTRMAKTVTTMSRMVRKRTTEAQRMAVIRDRTRPSDICC